MLNRSVMCVHCVVCAVFTRMGIQGRTSVRQRLSPKPEWRQSSNAWSLRLHAKDLVTKWHHPKEQRMPFGNLFSSPRLQREVWRCWSAGLLYRATHLLKTWAPGCYHSNRWQRGQTATSLYLSSWFTTLVLDRISIFVGIAWSFGCPDITLFHAFSVASKIFILEHSSHLLSSIREASLACLLK